MCHLDFLRVTQCKFLFSCYTDLPAGRQGATEDSQRTTEAG
jgi:hypothetical protein